MMGAAERERLLSVPGTSTSDVERATRARGADADDVEVRRPRVTRNTLATLAFAAVGALCVAAARGRDGDLSARRLHASQEVGGVGPANDATAATTSSAALGAAPTTEPPVEGVNVPTFIHIPKSGGTSVEDILGSMGINVGCCNPRRPYELREKFRGFESWHTPPASRVANSWAIVRNPYTRAVSEFLWQTNWGDADLFHSLNPGYSVHNCEAFQQYVKNHMWGLTKSELYGCYRQGGFDISAMATCDAVSKDNLNVGSHWIPQVVMTASAERVFQLEGCFSNVEGTCEDPVHGGQQSNILTFMRQEYDPLVSFDDKVNEWNARAPKPDLMSCWGQFLPEVLDGFNSAYADDFERYHYTLIKREPGALESAFVPMNKSSELIQSLGQIQDTLPTGETLQENVSPRCGGFRPTPPKA